MLALKAPVLALPLIALLPDQPPVAVQLLAFAADQLSIAAVPLVMLPGLALRLTAGAADVVAPFTWIENAGREFASCPLVTEIWTLPYVPAWALVGVPERRPVAMLKLAQAGLFFTEKDNGWAAQSRAVGWNV